MKFLLVIILFAVATYFLVRALQQRGVVPDKTPRATRPGRAAPPRIVAPDDDEDFLRDLDRKRLNPEDPEDR